MVWWAGVMLTPLVVWANFLLERVLKVRLPWPDGYMNVLWPFLVLTGMSVSAYAVIQSRYGRVAKAALLALSLFAVLFAGFLGLAVLFAGVRG
jgi:hypothetical protein